MTSNPGIYGLPSGDLVPNGAVKTLDSAAPSGQAWTFPADYIPPGMMPRAGYYYMGNPYGQNAAASSAHIANKIMAVPFYVPYRCEVDRIGVAVITGVAVSTIRVALYKAGSDGLPGNAMIAPTGTLDTSSAGGKEYSFAPVTVEAGWCWAVTQTGTTATFTTRMNAVDTRLQLGRSTLATVNPDMGIGASRTDADLPPVLTNLITWGADAGHGVMVRIA